MDRKLGIDNSFDSFENIRIVSRYLKYSCFKGQGYSAFLQALLEDFHLHGKMNSFETPMMDKESLFSAPRSEAARNSEHSRKRSVKLPIPRLKQNALRVVLKI